MGLHGTTWAALRSIGSWRDSTKGLTGASRGPHLVGPGRLTCYAIGTTASADPRGIFLPAQHWDGSPGKVIRHSTRQAARSFGGAGSRTTAGGPIGAMDTRCYPAMGCANAAFREFGASAGSRKMLRFKQRSNGIRLNSVVAGHAWEYKEVGDLRLLVRRIPSLCGVCHRCASRQQQTNLAASVRRQLPAAVKATTRES